jgi:hypothetical protein
MASAPFLCLVIPAQAGIQKLQFTTFTQSTNKSAGTFLDYRVKPDNDK